MRSTESLYRTARDSSARPVQGMNGDVNGKFDERTKLQSTQDQLVLVSHGNRSCGLRCRCGPLYHVSAQ